jgi:hypothetical protein
LKGRALGWRLTGLFVVFRGIGPCQPISFSGVYKCTNTLLRAIREKVRISWFGNNYIPLPHRFAGVSVRSVLMSSIQLADRPPHGQTHNFHSWEGEILHHHSVNPARLHRPSERQTTACRSSNALWTRTIPLPVRLCDSSMTDHDGGRVNKFLGP